jgi:hypothetical protein
MVFATFNIVLVIYLTCAIGRVFRRLIFFATFKNVSVIYHSFAVGRGVQDAHVLCRFQYCFSYLPLLCCRHGGSGGSCLLPLSIMFQSSTRPLL